MKYIIIQAKKSKENKSPKDNKQINKKQSPIDKKQTPKTDKKKETVIHEYVYYPLKYDLTGKEITISKGKYPYKLLHTSLDALIRHLQKNQLNFKYYTIVPLELIPVNRKRFNLEGEISSVPPYKFTVHKVYPLSYEKYTPTIDSYNRRNRLLPSYIFGLD